MKAIDSLLLAEDLSASQSERTFRKLFSRKVLDLEFAKTLLVLLRRKGEHSNELTGLVRAIRTIEKQNIKSRLPYLVDGCGTGGDGTHTFNISTIASIVAAGAGATVAKHGNRSISSRCGSADLLESLGVDINAPRERMLKALRECRIGYFHAPLYHRSFQALQPLRKYLIARYKMRTIFNLIGPLTNPLNPRRQAIGVFQKELVPVVAETARQLNFDHAIVFCSFDGMDELATTAKSLMIELYKGKLKKRITTPEQFGFKRGNGKDLEGGNPKINRAIAIRLLESKDTGARRDIVMLNAAAILYVSRRAKTFGEGIRLARYSIESKSALRTLRELVQFSHGTR